MSYTKQDWRSRNRIKTHQGVVWLTVPVQYRPSAQDSISSLIFTTADNYTFTVTLLESRLLMSSKKTIAIVQSNYIPWKGYFDLIRSSDEFILLDDVQYTRRDWRNRNKIKTNDGLKWLTIPVDAKGKYLQSIRDIQVSDPSWARQHFSIICHAYAKAPFLHEYKSFLEELFLGHQYNHLSEINQHFLRAISDLLEIHTPLRQSSEFQLPPEKTERLRSICTQAGADCYLSGPSAKNYLDENSFTDVGIEVVYIDYDGYAEYQQLHPPFEHRVSIIDALLNLGPEAITALDRTNS